MPHADVHALMIHGVGYHTGADFSIDARRNLRAALRAQGRHFEALEVCWGDIADRYEDAFLSRARELGSDGNLAQRLFVQVGSDATSILDSPAVRDEIFHLFDMQVARLKHSVTIFAHSLGCLLPLEYIRARPRLGVAGLRTMGLNLGGFRYGSPFEPPPQVELPGIWINYFTPGDGLGFPARATPGLQSVRDVRVSVGSWADRWSGAAHCRFWGSEKLWSRTIPRHL